MEYLQTKDTYQHLHTLKRWIEDYLDNVMNISLKYLRDKYCQF